MPEIAATMPLNGRMHAGNGVRLEPLGVFERLSLRLAADALAAVEERLGIALPKQPGAATTSDEITALWLGPDEWLLVGEPGSGVANAAEKLNGLTVSAVDISHRNVAIRVSGQKAALALNSGCPLDLRQENFPAGRATRTVLAKAEIVLIRTGSDTFHVECWRSFADYVWQYLVDAAKSA
jgi:sarcosine oxidase subunit gamma